METITAIKSVLTLGNGRPFVSLAEPAIRAASMISGAFFIILAVAFFVQADWAITLWPWPDVRMSYVFLASIAAAIAAPAIWVGITGELAGFAAIWLNSCVVHAGIATYLATRAVRHDEPRLFIAAGVSAVTPVVGAAIFRWSHRLPVRDPRPMPKLVRWSFVGFTTLLVVVAVPLLLQVPRVFPWNLAPETSTMFGCIFLGPSLFFAYGVARPVWAFAAGPLWSFLAYDVVLAIPYLQLLGQRADGTGSLSDYYGSYGAGMPATGSGVNEASLAVYLTILGVSTALAVYYLIVHRETRVILRPPTDPSQRIAASAT